MTPLRLTFLRSPLNRRAKDRGIRFAALFSMMLLRQCHKHPRKGLSQAASRLFPESAGIHNLPVLQPAPRRCACARWAEKPKAVHVKLSVKLFTRKTFVTSSLFTKGVYKRPLSSICRPSLCRHFAFLASRSYLVDSRAMSICDNDTTEVTNADWSSMGHGRSSLVPKVCTYNTILHFIIAHLRALKPWPLR